SVNKPSRLDVDQRGLGAAGSSNNQFAGLAGHDRQRHIIAAEINAKLPIGWPEGPVTRAVLVEPDDSEVAIHAEELRRDLAGNDDLVIRQDRDRAGDRRDIL